MSTNGVLSQIARGPWIDFVARNAACLALDRADDDEDEEEGNLVNGVEDDAKEAEERRQLRKKTKEKELQKQRMTGIGKSIDSEAFKAAVERGERCSLID
jgi:N-acetyl-beta-hexosaminidase